MIRSTYTYAILEVSHAIYLEIKDKLMAAGYSNQFHDDRDGDGVVIDMHGIALKDEGEQQMENKFIEEVGWPQVHGEPSSVKFTIQSGPIKEVGVNGCQIDDVIQWVKQTIEGFNQQFPCRENSMVITKLDEALLWSAKRKTDREKRSVEGTSQK